MTSPGRSAGAGTSRRRSRASRLGWIAAGASLGLVIVAAWSWRDARPFGLVPIIGLPERIQLCGRSYDGGGGGPVQTVTEVRGDRRLRARHRRPVDPSLVRAGGMHDRRARRAMSYR